MAQKIFECENCETTGKITVKNKELSTRDIACCPVCGASIWDEDDLEDDE